MDSQRASDSQASPFKKYMLERSLTSQSLLSQRQNSFQRQDSLRRQDSLQSQFSLQSQVSFKRQNSYLQSNLAYSQLSELCPECLDLDLHAAFELPTELGTRPLPLRDDQKDCSLCRLLVAICDQNSQELESPAEFWIGSVEYSEIMGDVGLFKKVEELRNAHILCLVARPLPIPTPVSYNSVHCAALREYKGVKKLDSQSRAFQGRLADPNEINYDLMSDWLAWCVEKHVDNCSQKAFGASYTLSRMGMRVIDCNERRLCAYRAETPYVALSYVWGSSRPHPDWIFGRGGKLPDSMPQTVEDALVVTRGLGLRYLWVDQFCINQQSEDDLDKHINKMNHIYAQAELVVIAAAGDNADYGLPGVSSERRACPSPVVLEGMTLVSALGRPATAIASSKWASRGWTYQEGVLARRRLIFTDEQVSFECHGMDCCESVSKPLSAISIGSKTRFKDDCTPGYFRGNCSVARKGWGLNSTRTEIWQHAIAYNQRELSFETDRLKAFMGILAKAGQHVYGIPIDSTIEKRAARWRSSAKASGSNIHAVSFSAGLCWHTARLPSNGLAQGQSVQGQQRRSSLPSFSWIGWTGEVSFDSVISAHSKRIYHSLVNFPDLKAEADWLEPLPRLQSNDGIRCDVTTLQMVMKLQLYDQKTQLGLQSCTDPSDEILFLGPCFKLSYPVLLAQTATMRPSSASKKVVLCERMECIRIMSCEKEKELEKIYLMIIKRHENFVERIGLLQLNNEIDEIEQLNEWPIKEETLVLR